MELDSQKIKREINKYFETEKVLQYGRLLRTCCYNHTNIYDLLQITSFKNLSFSQVKQHYIKLTANKISIEIHKAFNSREIKYTIINKYFEREELFKYG